MEAAGVPTAALRDRHRRRRGMAAIAALGGYPAVIKADGLAAGKGVVIAADEREAREALEQLLVEHRFGTERVLIEEHLVGEELSLLALCDGVSGRSRSPPRRTSSGSSTATAAPTPAAWAPIRRFRRSAQRRARGAVRRGPPARARRAAPPRDPVPRRPLRGPDDDRRRAEGARVQHPLRRPRDAGDPAAAAAPTCSSCCTPRPLPAGSPDAS